MDVKQTKFILKDFCFNLEIFLSEINCLIARVPETVLEIGKKTTFAKMLFISFSKIYLPQKRLTGQ